MKYETICIARVKGNIKRIIIIQGVSLKNKNWKDNPAISVEIADIKEYIIEIINQDNQYAQCGAPKTLSPTLIVYYTLS